MYLIICCNEYLKFEKLWDFRKHLLENHGYSREAADIRILKLIEQDREEGQWKVA